MEITSRRFASTHLLLGLVRLALALLHHVHDPAELADLEPGFAGERLISWRSCLTLSLSLAMRLFQPLAGSFETRLSQPGSSSEAR
jgi:hypothetical protein